MIRHTIILLLSTLTLVCSGQQAINNFRNNPMLRYANISLMVKDVASGKTIEEFNSHLAVIPASTMKIVSTASALEILGENFQFSTTLEVDGEIKPDGTLEGNLYIKGGGDPTLGSDKVGEKNFLPLWVDAVKKAGIKRILGGVIACEYCLERQVINPRWTWEDMGNYYAPGIHSISYLDNTYKLFFNSGKLDSTPQIIRIEPAIKGLQFVNYVKSTDTKSDNAYLYGAPYEYNRSIYGEIPANKSEFFIKGDIPHPAVLLAADFQQSLLAANINVSGISLVKMENIKS
ncbi:MAG: D-alanyl-D-alanine carboxypeptidase/D-alanyl-D-alanine-endopeptidase, partial [Paludibacter sp.]